MDEPLDRRVRMCVSLPASLLTRLERVIPSGRRSRALEAAAELVVEAHEQRGGLTGGRSALLDHLVRRELDQRALAAAQPARREQDDTE